MASVTTMESSLFELATRNLTIIDIRSELEFMENHIINSFNLPFLLLNDRKYELPPRYIKFFVVVCKKELNKVYDWFMKQPFNIEGFLIWEEINYLPKNNRNDKINNRNDKNAFPFQPCPLLKQEIKFMKSMIENNRDTNIIDLGCGSGRDIIFMAKYFDKSNIIAVDNLPGKITQVRDFAKNYNLSNIIEIQKDIRQAGSLHELFNDYQQSNKNIVDNGLSIVIISRFLCRDIFEEIYKLLNVGGMLCIHSFLTCNIKPKKMKDKIDVEELESVFHVKYGMKILRNNVYIQPDDGRKLSMFLAMKV